jgi:hypothetical protein
MDATLHVRFQLRKGEAAQRGGAEGDPLPPVHPGGLLPSAGVRCPPLVLRHHRHLGRPGGLGAVRGHHARSPQRAAQHD